jgi:hypothetical protein
VPHCRSLRYGPQRRQETPPESASFSGNRSALTMVLRPSAAGSTAPFTTPPSGDHSPGLPACFLWSLPLITLAGVKYRVARGASVVGILEVGLAVFVERADALDSVGMDGRAPVRLHHDRDGLLDWLALAHPDRLLDCLYRSR